QDRFAQCRGAGAGHLPGIPVARTDAPGPLTRQLFAPPGWMSAPPFSSRGSCASWIDKHPVPTAVLRLDDFIRKRHLFLLIAVLEGVGIPRPKRSRVVGVKEAPRQIRKLPKPYVQPRRYRM